MLNAIQAGIITESTKQRLNELEQRKKDIELQIIQEEIQCPQLSREDVTYWICRFRSLDVTQMEERRRLIDSFVNSVTVFDDYILITFNHKDGETRISFDDIKSSDLKSVGGPTIETCFLIRSKAGFFLILEKILANDLYSATFKVLFTEIYHVNPHISNNSHYIKYAYP